jgi:hypothetical protein
VFTKKKERKKKKKKKKEKKFYKIILFIYLKSIFSFLIFAARRFHSLFHSLRSSYAFFLLLFLKKKEKNRKAICL